MHETVHPAIHADWPDQQGSVFGKMSLGIQNVA
jgi:hypothetical protein